jgi:hypothetical protein
MLQRQGDPVCDIEDLYDQKGSFVQDLFACRLAGFFGGAVDRSCRAAVGSGNLSYSMPGPRRRSCAARINTVAVAASHTASTTMGCPC